MALSQRALAIAADNWDVYVVTSLLKFALVNSYRSTDFEVHRNWLAVTYHTRPSEWYFESTSEWTLDYPPAFAYFQWFMGQLAALIDADIVRLSPTPVDSPHVLLFQRISVLVADVVLFAGISLYAAAASRYEGLDSRRRWRLATWLAIGNAGLIIVDHIHFQYNGMLIGLLFMTMAMLRARMPCAAAVAFTLLCLTKHTFLFLAPLVAVWLVLDYVLAGDRSHWLVYAYRLSLLALSSLVTATLALAPVLASAPLVIGAQVLARCFPFSRGVVHTYWAPNAWAGYFTLDRVASAACRLMSTRGLIGGPTIGGCTSSTSTDGRLGTSVLHLLPAPTPAVSALAVVVSICLAVALPLWASWHQSRARDTGKGLNGMALPYAVAATWMCAFVFGWHVHEKAGLVALLSLCLAVGDVDEDGEYEGLREFGYRLVWRAAIPLQYCLAPLIFTPLEQPVVVALLVGHAACTWVLLGGTSSGSSGSGSTLRWLSLQWWESGYILLLGFVHAISLGTAAGVPGLVRLPFLHLLLTSNVCMMGVAYVAVASRKGMVMTLCASKNRKV